MRGQPFTMGMGDKRGRITLYCIAETFDRKRLEDLLTLTYPSSSIKSYPVSVLDH
jgi:hypothetical protein